MMRVSLDHMLSKQEEKKQKSQTRRLAARRFGNLGHSITPCTQVGHPHKPQPAEPQKKQEKKRGSISADQPLDSSYLLRRIKSKGAPSIAG